MKTPILFAVGVLVISCTRLKTYDKPKIVDFNNFDRIIPLDEIYNKVFYEVTQTDSFDILYHYCNASINTIKVYKDSIWEDFGQEYYSMHIKEVNHQKKSIIFYGVPEQIIPIKKYSFLLKDEVKGYWQINNKLFMDSLKINGIKQEYEPYENCW